MSGLGLSPLDVVDLEDVASHAACHHICLRLSLVNIIDAHGVSYELWRGGWPHLNFRELISRVQRVITLALGLELDNLGGCSADVVCLEIRLLLIQTNVKSSRS